MLTTQALTASDLFCTLLQNYAQDLPAAYANGDVLVASTSRGEMRECIMKFQESLELSVACGDTLPCDLDTVFPLRHMFAPGTYAREMTLPAAHIIIGKIHKHAHVNILSKGKVAVVTEDGVRVFTAPYSFVSEPFTKRIVYVIEPTIWTTIHSTTSTDLAEIEAELIATNYDNLPCADERELLCLGE